ncbi:MAG: inorganic phosphate transporter [Bacteroidota bacterium]|nr:inorganic phosphate transporter [Bacteroidota bacterium]
MENIYLYMLIALAILAVADLIVGVSNDAVNFLNSAIGSKAISFKTIMIVASIGVAVGAIFSSGMMEVARKGIFNPGEFMFDEIMIIFLAVMITDILLLDFFNTLGLPTSTTVSIVFELLGAAVVMALLKITASGGGFEDLWGYINTSKASQIIFGIILSVIVAFSVGAIVQWISRLLISFNFEQKPDWVGAVFSGIALTSITYFIFMKGLKGTSYANVTFDIINGHTVKDFLESKVVVIVLVSSVFWAVLSYILIAFAKTNIYKLIIVVGTFALALAFAGNDLVNFIGVPVAAYNSFLEWSVSGVAASAFPMDVLASKVPTNNLLLLGAGLVMVLTLWFSSKSKNVVQTSIDLSNQNTTKERFNPNVLSRVIVRASVVISEMVSKSIPGAIKSKIEQQFDQAKGPLTTIAFRDRPAFDMVRAAVNLMVASVLISIATSMKLPLSTTYVTFMVAMGTSLADRAWGVESAVYRVAGVLNVIGGWFFTAIVAFTASGLVAFLMNLNIQIMFPVLLFTAFGLLINSSFRYKKKAKLKQQTLTLKKSESRSVQGVINESSTNISKVLNRGGKIYKTTIFALAQQDLITLKKNKKQVVKLSNEIETLRDDIFYFIKSLDETSVSASNFYIEILGSLQDMTQSLDYITKLSYKHVNNNHKKLKFNQIKELSEISQTINILFKDAKEIFERQSFDRISLILEQKLRVNQALKLNIDTQVMRTRNEESSPKNTTLYFSLLLETKDLMNATASLLEQYNSNQLK